MARQLIENDEELKACWSWPPGTRCCPRCAAGKMKEQQHTDDDRGGSTDKESG